MIGTGGPWPSQLQLVTGYYVFGEHLAECYEAPAGIQEDFELVAAEEASLVGFHGCALQ